MAERTMHEELMVRFAYYLDMGIAQLNSWVPPETLKMLSDNGYDLIGELKDLKKFLDAERYRSLHVVRGGTPVEAWIMRRRNEYEQKYLRGDGVTEQLILGDLAKWRALADLLDDFRKHADTGKPLSEDLDPI